MRNLFLKMFLAGLKSLTAVVAKLFVKNLVLVSDPHHLIFAAAATFGGATL